MNKKRSYNDYGTSESIFQFVTKRPQKEQPQEEVKSKVVEESASEKSLKVSKKEESAKNDDKLDLESFSDKPLKSLTNSKKRNI